MFKKTFKLALVASAITLLVACGSGGGTRTVNYLDTSSAELKHIGSLIFRNETGGKKDNLAFWNKNEEFPSLGIGHFIWYPESFEPLFPDSFPGLIAFYKEQGIEPPAVLTSRYSAWPTREEFEAARSRGELKEVINFLDSTKGVQVQYIALRLKDALPKMMAASDRPDHVEQQFNRIMNSPNGLYPLIDYVNFKGEGVKTVPEYNDVGWGLRQVLEGMSGADMGKSAFEDFARSCANILTVRVENQPSGKSEQTFLPGWINRCKTYVSDTAAGDMQQNESEAVVTTSM